MTEVRKRYERIHYMNTGTTASPVWSLINIGVTAFDDSLEPQTEDTQYIADQNQTTIMTAYKPKFAYTAGYADTDLVCAKLYEIGADQLIGESVEIVTVDTWDVASGEYTARKGEYEVAPSKAGSGDPGAMLTMEGELNQKGDIVKGTFNLTTKVFTEEVES